LRGKDSEANEMRQTRCLAVLATSAIVALGGTAAFAGTTQYPTVFTKFKYKLADGEATFKGQIGSQKGGCIQDRPVKLYRQHSGKTKKIGGDRTKNNGKFEIDLGTGRPGDGKYYAKVKQTGISSGTCLGRTSGSVKLSSG
jgi:hypothetical protein